MNDWTNKDMNVLVIMTVIALSVSLALFFIIPSYVGDLTERVKVLEEENECDE